MNPLLRATILAGVIGVALLVAAGSNTGSSRPLRYVALGDSFSSGEGDPPYREASNRYLPPHDLCHRSYHAYPQLVADRRSARGRWSFWACSGASIRDMTGPNRENPVEKAQLDRVAPSGKPDPNVDLITLTIGGNDAQFNVVWLGCLASHLASPLGSCAGNWRGFVAAAIRRIGTALPPVLRALHSRAPNARILLLGYPDPFPGSLPPLSRCSLWLSDADVRWLGKEDAALNRTLRVAAKASGAGYVAPTGFAGHDVCSQDPWFNAIQLTPSRIRGSFHPNVRGQRQLVRRRPRRALTASRRGCGSGRER